MTLQCRDSSGNLIFDVDTIATAGVCLGIWEVPASTAFSQEFPGYTGSTIVALNPTGGITWNATIDNALGYPRVTCPAVPGNYILSIWAMTRPSFPPSGPGLFATRSDQNSLIFAPSGQGLYYVGDATVVSNTPNSGLLTSNGSMGWSTLEFTSATPVVPVLEVLPGYYTQLIDMTRPSSTVYRFRARRCDQSTTDSTGFNSLVTPRILCYGRKTTPNGPPYFAIYKNNGDLAWDLMSGSNSLLGALSTPSFSAAAGSASVTIGNGSETWGLIGPNGGYRRTGTVSGATWRMRELHRMYNRTVGGDLVMGEIAAFSYLADSNETNPFLFATNMFVTKHTGL